ncbi:MAG TPA: hypothetical protein VIA62_26535 [Thermoanaerobaculia bacterium]|jgi:hypothetical protein|nr:hypothetical protein [Thermoanaerobaculia bacterium]
MILVIRQYLASLRERGELDSILPDLLSQLGLTVFSRPRRGTRQDGVDVGAVGKIGDGDEKVYLFSIKAGDLTRREWEGDVQALRPSLVAILEVYVRNRLPPEHRGKPIVVCICLGGDVREEVRPDLVGFIEQHSSSTVSFEEWNGDKLAMLIQSSFLREELLPVGARSSLRKALALLDEPESSFVQFTALIRSLAAVRDTDVAAQVTAIRQMSLCLRILFAWCRDAGNTEAAFLAGEFTLLHGWAILKKFASLNTKDAEAVRVAFLSIYEAYQEICGDFITGSVLPNVSKLHGLSTAVRGSCSVDINLKLFDLIGRVGVTGLWVFWTATRVAEDQAEERTQLLEQAMGLGQAAKAMIANNPVLLLPATEDQAIDVAIVLLLLAHYAGNTDDMKEWLREILQRASFALRSHGRYPSIVKAYGELLLHPKLREDEYRKEVTAGSILYPLIAVWAALFNEHTIYEEITTLRREFLSHCAFQYWFPDEATEEHLYTGGGPHGATLTNVCVDRAEANLLDQLFFECEAAPHFEELSAVKFGWWPLVVVACRHHRLPLPLHFLKPLRIKSAETAGGGVVEEGAEA